MRVARYRAARRARVCLRRMKRTAILLSIVVSLAACQQGDASPKAAPIATKTAAPPEPPPPPFTGKLTIERVLAAKADPLKPWADSLARLEGQLGKPTRTSGNKFEWAVVEGDDCAYTYVEKEDGAKFNMQGEIVGTTMPPMKVGKDGPMVNRTECLGITGVTAGPPEDPNAIPPAADGGVVTVEVFRSNAIIGRSKWKDQAVKVSGVLDSVSTSTAGSDSFITVSLKASGTDADKPVTCSYEQNAAAPTLKTGDAVIASGTVAIREWMSGSGTTLEAVLDKCTVAAAAPADQGTGPGKGKGA
jgi:hypothetical protein